MSPPSGWPSEPFETRRSHGGQVNSQPRQGRVSSGAESLLLQPEKLPGGPAELAALVEPERRLRCVQDSADQTVTHLVDEGTSLFGQIRESSRQPCQLALAASLGCLCHRLDRGQVVTGPQPPAVLPTGLGDQLL